MKKKWLIASYKRNEVNRVQSNLLNQNFDFYLPKIKVKKINAKPKMEVLFPGYIFVNTDLNKYTALKYTLGIRNVIKFGDSISCISRDEIKAMQMAEKKSIKYPVASQIRIGQDAIISKGSLSGSIVKVCSLPSNERVDVLLHFLGSVRRVTVPQQTLIF